jgi:hypothetical protein
LVPIPIKNKVGKKSIAKAPGNMDEGMQGLRASIYYQYKLVLYSESGIPPPALCSYDKKSLLMPHSREHSTFSKIHYLRHHFQV